MRHLASQCRSPVQKECEMLISSSLTGPLDIVLAKKYSQELAELGEMVQEIAGKSKFLLKRIEHLDEKNWQDLSEILSDLEELKSRIETMSKELKNQIGEESKYGLEQLKDSLASKIDLHIETQDLSSSRELVEPSDLTEVGPATSVPQTTQAGIQKDQLTIALETEVAGINCIGGGLDDGTLSSHGHKNIVVDMGGRLNIYCLRCKDKTMTTYDTISKLANGRTCVNGICARCGARKRLIIG